MATINYTAKKGPKLVVFSHEPQDQMTSYHHSQLRVSALLATAAALGIPIGDMVALPRHAKCVRRGARTVTQADLDRIEAARLKRERKAARRANHSVTTQ